MTSLCYWSHCSLSSSIIVCFPSLLTCHVDLTVAVDGNKKITLPDNTVEIFASAWPKSEPLTYRWEKVFGPNEGALSGINQDSVTLSGVSRIGVYEVVSVFVTDCANCDGIQSILDYLNFDYPNARLSEHFSSVLAYMHTLISNLNYRNCRLSERFCLVPATCSLDNQGCSSFLCLGRSSSHL